ncbi:hypothetical protein RN001_009654 [Aquatica leii]|uniref:Uncharacterized protein n=1 Tax=Aquatica leii TaxID=1421715 RepID=A0AAN7P6X8_9COLE|nr:hypothetical protein RN001_009654 [Aquatica leii]
MANIIYSLIWLLILIFISFWVAGFCFYFYVLLYTLAVCITALNGICETLLAGIQFPHYCAEQMMNGTPLC